MDATIKHAIAQLFFLTFLTTAIHTATAQQGTQPVSNLPADTVQIMGIKHKDSTTVTLQLSNQQHLLLQFYSDEIFRLFYDKTGGPLRPPLARPQAKILVDQPFKSISKLVVGDVGNEISISTGTIKVVLNKTTTRMIILNSKNN